jgi:electron transfer flavoprotein alpha subunit
MTTLVFAETPQLAGDLVARATALGPEPLVLALRPADGRQVAADVVLAPASGRAEDVVPALAELAAERGADVVLLAATVAGREIAARLAMRWGAALVPEATSLALTRGGGTAERVVHGGAAVQAVAWDGPVVVTVAPRPGPPAEPSRPAEVVEIAADARVTLISREPLPRGEVDLADADRLVCVGMGVRAEADLALVGELAEALGAPVACTRPVAEDRGWLPSDRYVGISGRHVSPRLYLGLGVSGQVQHAVGMRGSSVVVTVNSDEHAPAVTDADHAVVADLYQVVPALVAALRRRAAR